MSRGKLSAYLSPRTTALRRLDSTRDVRHGAVVIQRTELFTSMDPSKEPLSTVHNDGLFLNLTTRTNDTITVEWTYCAAQSWTPIEHFLLEHSSITNPDFVNVKLASNQRQYVLRNCIAGTTYFFIVSSVDVYGKVIIRSKQITIQASAPVDRPTLKLKQNIPNSVIIEWSKPIEYGDGFISEYHLKLNGIFHTNIRSTKTSYEFIECKSLETYTFRIQALSIKHDCNSEWSNVLEVACPAALPMTLKRLPSNTVNTVRVGWNLPMCKGGAKVKEFKVYFKAMSSDELYNDQLIPDPDKICYHRHACIKCCKPDAIECCVTVDPLKDYWATLRAEIIPEGCPVVHTNSIRVRATIKPVAPRITLNVYGRQERMDADKEIAILLGKRDKIKRRKVLFQSNNAVAGAQLRDDEIQDMNVILYQIEKRMNELVSVVNKITGFVPVVLKWEKPVFDEFSEPSYYRINVDDHSYQNHLPLDCTEHSLKLDVEKISHTVSVTTLSSHPVGDSEHSNVEVLSAKEFRPNRFFCYFTSHNKDARWPNSGACRLEDFLAYEKKLTCKKNVHRGLLKTRLILKPLKVIGIHDDTEQSLIRHFSKKSSIILFWTKWCVSSQNMLERFSNFAYQSKDKYVYNACCVKSGEDSFSHRKSVIDVLNEKNLRVRGNVRYSCACHTSPEFRVEKMAENPNLPINFELDGVPTFFILDNKGRLAWKGRVAADNDETFMTYMTHVMARVDEQRCPTHACPHCADEDGVTYFPENGERTGDSEDKEGESNNCGGDDDDNNNNGDYNNNITNNNNDNNTTNDDVSHATCDKYSLDEFHLLHSRLHGQGLEEAEKTQGEEYAKLGTCSPRKEWLERRRANAKANNCITPQSLPPPTNQQVEREGIARSQSNGDRISNKNRPPGRPKIFQYRQADRNYRSPNTGSARPKYGYGSTSGNSLAKQVPVITPPPSSRYGSYKDVNYHTEQRISKGEPAGIEYAENDRDENYARNRKATSSLAARSSQGYTPWNSAIKPNNVSRDSSRTDALSSTWPRSGSEHQEEEVREFMIPINQRAKTKSASNVNWCPSIANKSGEVYNSSPEQQTGNTQTYVYRRPSVRGATAPATRGSKKKQGKFAKVESRYKPKLYNPGQNNQGRSRTVLSAKAHVRSRRTPSSGRGHYGYNGHESRDN